MKNEDKVDEYELNDGHIFEAIDRIQVAIIYLRNALAEQTLIASVEDFQSQTDKAVEILSDLYQTVGNFDSVAEISEKYTLRLGYNIRK